MAAGGVPLCRGALDVSKRLKFDAFVGNPCQTFATPSVEAPTQRRIIFTASAAPSCGVAAGA